jgi:nitric oxide reductase activation protein
LAISIGLEAIPGVNPAVTFFANDASNPVLSIVKHGEKPQRQAAKFAFNARGYTPMTEAIWYGAFELSKTREARKMLIVITDGAPDDLSSCRSVISLCERSGIGVCGIGIEMDLSHLFRQHISIDEVGSLQSALFGLMQQSLTTTAA